MEVQSKKAVASSILRLLKRKGELAELAGIILKGLVGDEVSEGLLRCWQLGNVNLDDTEEIVEALANYKMAYLRHVRMLLEKVVLGQKELE
jgi:hypothetical protein